MLKNKQEKIFSLQGPENSQGWDLVGDGAKNCVHFEDEGLRITLPTGWGGIRPSTGVGSGMVLKGDFEISMRFDILKEPEVIEKGPGTRLSMGIILDTPQTKQATVSRSISAKAGKVFVVWSSVWDEETQKDQQKARFITTKATSGELRLVREGSVLSYYVSEKPGGDFILVQQYPFGEEDVKEIRIAGSTGSREATLDARITDLRIRAESLPGSPVTFAQTPAKTSGSLVVMIVIFLALTLVGFAVWWFVRHRSNSVPPEESSLAEEEFSSAEDSPLPPDAEEEHPQKEPIVVFECQGCHKNLKAKGNLAGKRIRCPQCSHVTIVETAIKRL